jgi:hypothetical protein
VASLGAITLPPSVADRLSFWRGLQKRLAKLLSRVDADTQAKILTTIHARVPIVATSEQRGIGLELPSPTLGSAHDMHAGSGYNDSIATPGRAARKQRGRERS